MEPIASPEQIRPFRPAGRPGNGCRSELSFRPLVVDRIIPQRAGGQDYIENLQLLCAHCNRVKGDRPQEYLNQYQGGMCISGRLTMTERTTRDLISPLGPNWVGTDSAV